MRCVCCANEYRINPDGSSEMGLLIKNSGFCTLFCRRKEIHSWGKALEMGGMACDNIHRKLRRAIMIEDRDSIRLLILVDKIPLDAFNRLADVIANYHEKSQKILTEVRNGK